MTPDGGGSSDGLVLPDIAALSDLETFVGRATRIDPGGAVRLVAHGQVLAIYASALHGGGGPTVLALRVISLAEPSDLDATVPSAALTDRFALTDRKLTPQRLSDPNAGAPIRLQTPSMNAAGVSWAGLLPPRVGWSVEGVLRVSDLRRAAKAGIDEVAAGTPQGSGAAAVAKLRALVWGRPLPWQQEIPAGAAFAAEAFGFLGSARPDGSGSAGYPASISETYSDADEVFDQYVDRDAVSVHSAGRWWRLSMTRGHVLVRPATALA